METIHQVITREGDPTQVHIWWPKGTLHQDRAGANARTPLRVEWYGAEGKRLDEPPPGWSAEPWKDHELQEWAHEVKPGVRKFMVDAPEEIKEHFRSQGIDID